jgi:hypothetical protein
MTEITGTSFDSQDRAMQLISGAEYWLNIGGDGMAILSVGPGQRFTTIAAAVAASNSGDTINVQAGTYTNDFFYIGHSLTLQAIGGVAKIIATQSALFGKAIIVKACPVRTS